MVDHGDERDCVRAISFCATEVFGTEYIDWMFRFKGRVAGRGVAVFVYRVRFLERTWCFEQNLTSGANVYCASGIVQFICRWMRTKTGMWMLNVKRSVWQISRENKSIEKLSITESVLLKVYRQFHLYGYKANKYNYYLHPIMNILFHPCTCTCHPTFPQYSITFKAEYCSNSITESCYTIIVQLF